MATLVARDSAPDEVLAAVAREVGRLLQVEATAIVRYESDGTGTVVAEEGERVLEVGTRTTLDDENVGGLVLRTGRPARVDDFSNITGRVGSRLRELGVGSMVGTPIVVDGQLWGVMIAASRQAEAMSPGTEARIGEFTELVGTAISNVQARSDLAASRTRIVAAADQERREVVRDLHDGAQQRLVHTIITLKMANEALDRNQDPASELVAEALQNAERANAELRELAHGILPAVLTQGGLRAGVDSLAARMPMPVKQSVAESRLPAPVEATAYFIVAEALTNVAKHAGAGHAEVTVRIENRTLAIQVRDDGIGGADRGGQGLVGISDRATALGGRLEIESPAGAGTIVAATLPLSAG